MRMMGVPVPPNKDDSNIRCNENINASEVRVVDADGNQLGILPIHEALMLAREKGLDLVEVAPNASPPVCRIMDVGKFKYQQQKKAQAAKKKQHVIQVKEIRMRPKIDQHDYNVKLKHLRRFLEEGNKAKVTVRFRGREMAFVEAGHEVIQRLVEDLSDIATIEKLPEMDGRFMVAVFSPKQQDKVKKGSKKAAEEKKDSES